MDSPTETGLEISDDSNSFEEIPAVSDPNTSASPVTPKTDRIPVALSFGSGSSDMTPNHDSDSSFSELDSEAEAFYSSLNHHLVSPGIMDSHGFADKQMSYGELMKKFVQCEEELRTTSLKLQDSEQEIEKLKSETANRESAILLATNLRAELERVQRELEMKDKDIETEKRESAIQLAENLRAEIEKKDTEIETEKRRALELERQVGCLETNLFASTLEFEKLVNELEVSKECLALSDVKITNLETDIAGLLKNKTFLEAQIKETDTEKMEMKSKEEQLEAEINALKTDLASRDNHIEALNKEFDKHKVRYDMLMAEKDGVCAEVDNLKAEMRSRDIQIKQMEEQLNRLVYRETELVSESGNAKNTVEELRSMVKELEKQAELQRNAISEGEEEKREAIRQLCFSLDHYKSGYRQVLRFLSDSKKQ